MLDKEKAEILGSVLVSGFGTGGASVFGAEVIASFVEAVVCVAIAAAISSFGVLTSTIEYPPFLK